MDSELFHTTTIGTTMSEYTIQVEAAITIAIDYDEYTLDSDQAELLWKQLGEALGKSVGGK